MLTVCKSFDFCYGHCLPGYDGKCANEHGHNSTLEVEFREGSGWAVHQGFDYPGILVDFGTIKKHINPILEELDHKMLNKDVEFFKTQNPTAENIVRYITEKIHDMTAAGCLPPLTRVRVYENRTSYAEWKEVL